MLLILSPTKTMSRIGSSTVNFDAEDLLFSPQTQKLVSMLKRYSIDEIKILMDVSNKLAQLNHFRFQQWEELPQEKAIFSYKGEAFSGLDPMSMDESQINFAENHLCIISGLYGILRPCDIIKPYRLDLGIVSKNLPSGGDLYKLWTPLITSYLRSRLKENESIVNLSSSEYFRTINKKELKRPIITPMFKDLSHSKYKMIPVYVKKARGRMARFIIDNEINNNEDLKAFDKDGYYFSPHESNEQEYVFLR